MSTRKYISLNKLSNFLDKLKNTFASIKHIHTLSEISDYVVDTELSSTSENPVQNKVIDAELDEISTAFEVLESAVDDKADASHTHDDRYYTESEIDTLLINKADSTHNHDDDYDLKGTAETKADEVRNELTEHTGNTSNPHNVTKAQIGLGNVDNTADADKNVASAAKLTNARTISLSGAVSGSVSFDGSQNVTIDTSSRRLMHATGNAATGYLSIATLTVTASYQDRPISMTLLNRATDVPCHISIRFANANSTDPALKGVQYWGDDYGVFICKTSTSTWTLYCEKSVGYGDVAVFDILNTNNGVTVTLLAEYIAEKPTENVVNAVLGGTIASADRLSGATNIGKASFDATKDIDLGSIMGRATLPSSSSDCVGKYSKFATVDVSSSAYMPCAGTFNLLNNDKTTQFGILNFRLRATDTISTTAITLTWSYLQDPALADSVVAVKVSDSVYDLYFKAVTAWTTYHLTLIDCFRPENITLHNSQAYVDASTLTIAHKSTLAGIVSNVANYGVCETAGEIAEKTVTCSGFTLYSGNEITVKFAVTNTASNPKLNVNGTGDKFIYHKGLNISAGALIANSTYTFRYNGTQYDLVGDETVYRGNKNGNFNVDSLVDNGHYYVVFTTETTGTIPKSTTVDFYGFLEVIVNAQSSGMIIQRFTAKETGNIYERSRLQSSTSWSPWRCHPTLSGLNASVTELNHMDGVTSNVQGQFDTSYYRANRFFPDSAMHNLVTDCLQINTAEDWTSNSGNRDGVIATEDASTIANCPVSSGAFYAYREIRQVEAYGGAGKPKTIVTLKEAYPIGGREWSRSYNPDTSSWSDYWSCHDGACSHRDTGKSITDIVTNSIAYVCTPDRSTTKPICASEFTTGDGHNLTEKVSNSDIFKGVFNSGNIDELKTYGIYWVQLNQNSTTITGTIPPYVNTQFGYFEVIKAYKAGTDCMQRFTEYFGGVVHTRVYVNGGWLDWETSINSDSPQALTNKTYNGYTLGDACAKSYQDSTAAGTLSSSRTGLCTERDIYYGLPTINGSHTYTSSTNIYAPTSVGSKGQVLVSNGSGAPSWQAMSSTVKILTGTVSISANDDWANGTANVTFSSSFSVAPMVQASSTDGKGAVHVTSISKTGCTISYYAAADQGTKTIRWTAMGY